MLCVEIHLPVEKKPSVGDEDNVSSPHRQLYDHWNLAFFSLGFVIRSRRSLYRGQAQDSQSLFEPIGKLRHNEPQT